MNMIWKLVLAALVFTLFLFMEILACVLFPGDGKDVNFFPLFLLLPAFLGPLPLILLRRFSSDDAFASSPRGRHWAEFGSSFFGSGLIGIPVLLYTTQTIQLGALLLSLGGLAVLMIAFGAWITIKIKTEGGDTLVMSKF
mmetsp:Transcript_52824/g.87735  ORF Transcript_52824/g.87735 Transcript_52824/m.87735 type:complete len:140 (+) Transcript_52824:35-454(+)